MCGLSADAASGACTCDPLWSGAACEHPLCPKPALSALLANGHAAYDGAGEASPSPSPSPSPCPSPSPSPDPSPNPNQAEAAALGGMFSLAKTPLDALLEKVAES